MLRSRSLVRVLRRFIRSPRKDYRGSNNCMMLRFVGFWVDMEPVNLLRCSFDLFFQAEAKQEKRGVRLSYFFGLTLSPDNSFNL